MKKSIKQLIALAAVGTISFGSVSVLAQDDSSEESVSTEEVMEDESSAEQGETIERTIDIINSDEEVIGTAKFVQDEEGNLTMHLVLENLEEGEYGMHIHEVGLATAPDFEDAGSHFNPTDVEHGTESETGPHLGDLPNLVVGEDGTVDEVYELPGLSLAEDAEHSLQSTDGTTLIIHTEADDYESQPTGDAGDRQAAGIIFQPKEDSEFHPDNAGSTEESEETEESAETEETEESAE